MSAGWDRVGMSAGWDRVCMSAGWDRVGRDWMGLCRHIGRMEQGRLSRYVGRMGLGRHVGRMGQYRQMQDGTV